MQSHLRCPVQKQVLFLHYQLREAQPTLIEPIIYFLRDWKICPRICLGGWEHNGDGRILWRRHRHVDREYAAVIGCPVFTVASERRQARPPRREGTPTYPSRGAATPRQCAAVVPSCPHGIPFPSISKTRFTAQSTTSNMSGQLLQVPTGRHGRRLPSRQPSRVEQEIPSRCISVHELSSLMQSRFPLGGYNINVRDQSTPRCTGLR